MFENLYGLSCIENQTLAILRNRGMDIRPLYRDCAMPIKELFFFLIYHGNKQEYFDRITRVQDLAKELGIISLKLYGQTVNQKKSPIMQPQHFNPEEMITALRNIKENEYILMRVTKEFTKERLRARGLRNDHFVAITINGNHFDVINDIPETSLTLTIEELNAAYDGEFFKLSLTRNITDADRKKAHIDRVFKAEKNTGFTFDISDFDPVRRFPNEPKEVGIRMRNMVGVYKTLRYRMAEYYGQYINTDFIRKHMNEVEKYYSLFEYYNLKKNTPFERYFEVFCKLNQMDTELNEELKVQLHKRIYA